MLAPSFLKKALSFVGVSLLSSTAWAHDCPTDELIQADLGNQLMAFVETGTHEYFSSGLAGRIELDGSGVLVAAHEDKRQGNPADLRMEVVGGVWDWRADLDSRVLGDVTYIAPSGSVTTMPGYERVLAPDIVPGVHGTAQSSGRRFELILHSDDEKRLEFLHFRFPTALATQLDGQGVQVLEPAQDMGAVAKRLDVDLLALEETSSGLRPIPSQLVEEPGGLFRPSITGNPSGRVHLRLTVLFGPYQNPADLVRASDGGLMAVHSVRAGSGSPRRNGVLTRLSADGRSITQRVWIDTGDDLDLRAVAEGANGEILLAGGRDSGSQGRSFLASYRPEERRFQRSEAIEYLGHSGIGGLNVAEDGRVQVIGLVDEAFEPIQPQAAHYALALPSTEVGEVKRVLVGELTSDLGSFIFADAQDAVVGPWRLDVWVDCHGALRAGVYFNAKREGDIHHSYTFGVPSSAMANCPLIGRGYGDILMCSKWLMGGSPGTYDPAAVPASAVPSLTVERPDPGTGATPDYEVLNELEDNVHGPIFSLLPGGQWTHWDNYFYSSTHAALTFVYYNEWWNSMMAFNARVPAGTSPPTFKGVAARKAEFRAGTNADLPHNVCNYLSGGNGWPHLEVDVADACQTSGSGSFELEEITYDLSHQGTYYPDQVLPQITVATWFPAWDGTPGVGDPPVPGDGDEPAPPSSAHLVEIGSRLESRAMVTLELVETVVAAGAVKESRRFEASIASRDTH